MRCLSTCKSSVLSRTDWSCSTRDGIGASSVRYMEAHHPGSIRPEADAHLSVRDCPCGDFVSCGFSGLRWTGDPGSGVDVGFIQRFVKQELFDDGVELVPVLLQDPPRVRVALVGDPADFLIHRVEHAVGYSGHARIAVG